MPKLRIEETAARRQARIDRGEDVIVGVNKYQLAEEPEIDVRDIDNTRRARGADRAARSRSARARDAGAVERALDALHASCARAGKGNLLAAGGRGGARARDGRRDLRRRSRRSTARYRAEVRSISGVYGAAYQGDDEFDARCGARSSAFAAAEGRRPRMLVVKLGQDGHDRGVKVIATAFADLGFDVDVGPLFQTPEEVARQAIENDVHVVGVSSQAGGHKTLVPRARAGARARGRAATIAVVVGGIIPPQDYAFLREQRRRGDLRARHARCRRRRARCSQVIASARGRRARRGAEPRSPTRRSWRGDPRRRPARAREGDHAAREHARRSRRARRRRSSTRSCPTRAARCASASPARPASARARSSRRSACT